MVRLLSVTDFLFVFYHTIVVMPLFYYHFLKIILFLVIDSFFDDTLHTSVSFY